MEGEKFLMAAGVTAAVVVGAFVFWGPSGSSVFEESDPEHIQTKLGFL